MKKLLSVALSLLLLLSCAGVNAFAGEGSVTVYVSVADKGSLVVAQAEVVVADIDNDGAITVNDALFAVHENAYTGGAKAGYNYYIHKDYGLSMGKLWGDTSGNFGYYLNNKSCWSLADTVSDGDYLNAFVYADGKFYSDAYCFFNEYSVTADKNEEIELTLNGAGYDASWNPVTVPIAGAEITVDGAATGVITDENGKATIKISDAGEHTISAVSSSKTLVPPVCSVHVNSFFETVINAVIGFFADVYNFIVSLFN